MSSDTSALWTCPRFGHRFVTRNMWHSCGRYDIDAHFAGKDPIVREIFQRLAEAAQQRGPLTAYAQKTRIVFMVRVRFAGLVTGKRWLYLSLWLARRVAHPTLHRVEVFGPRSFYHHFRLTEPTEVDARLESLICEAYAVGKREYLFHGTPLFTMEKRLDG